MYRYLSLAFCFIYSDYYSICSQIGWGGGLDSLVSENVSILVGVEGQFEDAIHDAALDGHLGVLQLLLTSILPNGIRGHGTVQVTQKILHRRRLVIRCRAAQERWRDRNQ